MHRNTEKPRRKNIPYPTIIHAQHTLPPNVTYDCAQLSPLPDAASLSEARIIVAVKRGAHITKLTGGIEANQVPPVTVVKAGIFRVYLDSALQLQLLCIPIVHTVQWHHQIWRLLGISKCQVCFDAVLIQSYVRRSTRVTAIIISIIAAASSS